MHNLGDLLKVLMGVEIDFVLVGGFASVVYGSSMVTRDLDICTLITSEEIEKLRQCLKDFHPKHRMTPKKLSFLEFPAELKGVNNIYLETDLGVLDVISQVTGVGTYGQIKSRSIEIALYGKKCKLISLDDLITSKKAMGRDKDKAVVKELEAVRKAKGSSRE